MAAYGGRGEDAVGPRHIDLEAAYGAQAADGAALPGVGQGRQQVEGVGVALQQHLCHAGGDAEVAVYLERCVRVEEVVIDSALRLVGAVALAVLEGRAEEFDTLVGHQGAGVEVHLPPHAPARGWQPAQDEAPHGGFVVGV